MFVAEYSPFIALKSYIKNQLNIVIQKSTTQFDFENRAKCLLYKNLYNHIYKIFVADYLPFIVVN